MRFLCKSCYSEKQLSEHCNFIVDILVTLGEMITANTQAKEFAIEMGVIESIARLLDVQRALNLMPIKAGTMLTRGIPTGSTKRSSLTPVQNLRICSSCYDVLIALLEYDGHLQDVEDKISDVINVSELQQSVSDHLLVLKDSTDHLREDEAQEVREIASAATFKGYNVLKKISNEATDKRISLPNIDEQLEKDVNADCVEIMCNGSLEKLYFPNTCESLLRRKVKDIMLWGLSRKTQTDKNVDFLCWAEEILLDMRNVSRLQQFSLVHALVNLEFLWDWIVLLIAVVIQIWLLVDLEDYGMNQEGDGDVSEVRCGEQVLNQSWKHLVHVGSSRGGDEKQQVCVSASYYTAHRILGGIQMLAVLLLTLTYILTNSHRFKAPSFNWRSFIFRGKSSETFTDKQSEIRRMSISLSCFYHIWLVIMIVTSYFGIRDYGVMFCIHLLHIIPMFDLLTRVIKGATVNRNQLLVVIPFALVIIYIYSMIYFHITRTMFLNSAGEYCDTLFQCFTTALRYSVRTSNGGHNYSWTNKRTFPDVWLRIAIDGSFWLLYSIIGMKVVTALVLDGYVGQKKSRETAEADMSSLCTICGLKKDDFSSKGISWKAHLTQEHNIWSYVKLFYNLQMSRTKRCKLSTIEEEVLQKFKNKDISFLPRKTSFLWREALKREDNLRNKLRGGN